MRSSDQFRQFFRVIEPFLRVLLIASQGSRGQLRRYSGFFQAGISSHEEDLIDADSLGSGQGSFQSLGKFSGFGSARGKRLRKAS